MDNEVVFYTF